MTTTPKIFLPGIHILSNKGSYNAVLLLFYDHGLFFMVQRLCYVRSNLAAPNTTPIV